jgi:PAS domain S-box-containing protein
MRLSLAAKGLILVSIPLLFELGVVAVLVNLQKQAEAETANSQRSRRVAAGISRLSAELFDLWQNVVPKLKKQWATSGNFDQSYKVAIDKLNAEYAELESLCNDQPEIQSRLKQSREILTNAQKILDHAAAAMESGFGPAMDKEDVEVLRNMPASIRQLGEKNQELEAIYRRDWADRSPNRHSELREQTLGVAAIAAVVNVFLSIALAIFLLKDVTGRLRVLKENAERLATGMQLRAPLQGSDEIAEADRVFRKMARALNDLSHKERAVIENALDTICAVDKDGRFLSVNPASFDLFGLEPDELIGYRLVDMIDESSREEMLSWMNSLRNHSGDQEREFVVRKRLNQQESSYVDTLWSGHWSEVERSLFFVVHDMTDRKELERAKQEMVAMFTHDLRLPLSTIQGTLEMADAGMLGQLNERGERLIKAAEKNGVRMIGLINDLLDIEKIKSGTMVLTSEIVDLQEVFNTVKQNVAALTEEGKIHFEWPPTNLAVVADKEKLNRVIFNLVSNAIKFSPPDSRLILAATISQQEEWKKESSQKESAKPMVEITVTDQGPGIPPDMVSTIFERFQQVSDSTHNSKGGTGLGLTICKEIVNLHGGQIWVTNGKQKGSVFHFTLPSA